MPNDINELDEQDVGLKGIFGSRFEDETEEGFTLRKSTTTNRTVKTAQKRTERVADNEYEDADWCPVQELSFTQKLIACAKKAWIYAVLCWVFFYWQQTGQMEATAAQLCMVGCATLLGCTYGRVFKKEVF